LRGQINKFVDKTIKVLNTYSVWKTSEKHKESRNIGPLEVNLVHCNNNNPSDPSVDGKCGKYNFVQHCLEQPIIL
jgi:hypothetical protein